ncbi:sensor histidine kinase [Cytophagaceae bacterium YF14B1]|uniref:histidine kinase n=1 Tax=Xanthocytophaga flava TaxID=3048013 RepID=A0AAE3U6U1_9BACT|nr:sensor histidine kinase [Xanthocytophaga flavus]MDJ1478984.1 sensor histidine kinase [Xanthocytophaga flavus]
MTKSYNHNILYFVWGICVLLFPARSVFANAYPQATKGVLDLSKWDWQENGITELSGEWEWYWNGLYSPEAFYTRKLPVTSYISVPGVWNSNVAGSEWKKGHGYCTYRLKIILPDKKQLLALKVLTASTAMEMYVDGQKVGQEGRVGHSFVEMTPEFSPFEAVFMPTGDTLEILVPVSNFHYRKGGLWNVIKLGPAKDIQHLRVQNLTLDYFVVGSFLLIGLYHLFLYIFLRRNPSPLYFFIVCNLLSIRILTTGEYGINVWADISWNTLIHLEFLSLYLSPLVFVLYSRYLFPKEVSGVVTRWVVWIGFLFAGLTLLFPPDIFSYGVRPFQIYIFLIAIYGATVYFKAWKNQRVGSTYFLFGFVVLFLMIVNDILYTSFIIQTGHFFYIGLVVFVFSQALTLSRQYSIAFSDLEQANVQLETGNLQLKEKNKMVESTNEQLQKLNAEMDGVVYRVSHDLRSPIASVLGLIDLIRKDKTTGDSLLPHYIDLQEKTLRRMDLLIQDIIDYARNNNTDLQLEEVSCPKLIEDILTDLSHLEEAIKIEKIVEVNQTGVFYSDTKRLNMIFSNLISNAIRYHNLNQSSPSIRIRGNVTPEKAVIEIIDNGQGISSEHLEKIFDRFYRANHATKGSGLGLYIVKEAVEKLNGVIAIESEINQGTTFKITLPNLAEKIKGETKASISE